MISAEIMGPYLARGKVRLAKKAVAAVLALKPGDSGISDANWEDGCAVWNLTRSTLPMVMAAEHRLQLGPDGELGDTVSLEDLRTVFSSQVGEHEEDIEGILCSLLPTQETTLAGSEVTTTPRFGKVAFAQGYALFRERRDKKRKEQARKKAERAALEAAKLMEHQKMLADEQAALDREANERAKREKRAWREARWEQKDAEYAKAVEDGTVCILHLVDDLRSEKQEAKAKKLLKQKKHVADALDQQKKREQDSNAQDQAGLSPAQQYKLQHKAREAAKRKKVPPSGTHNDADVLSISVIHSCH